MGIWSTQQNAEKAGQNKMGFALGLRRLKTKGFVTTVQDEDYNGNISMRYSSPHRLGIGSRPTKINSS